MSKAVKKKKFLTKAEILGIEDLEMEEVQVPEWGGWVRVSALTGAERDRFEAGLMGDRVAGSKNRKIKLDNMRAKLVALAIVGEDGQRLFNDQEVAKLGRKSAAALDRVFGVAQRLSGFSDQDLDDLTKNLNGAQSADSISD